MVHRLGKLKVGELAEFLFYKKDRVVDWRSAELEKAFPPDAIFSGGKWLKGEGLVPKISGSIEVFGIDLDAALAKPQRIPFAFRRPCLMFGQQAHGALVGDRKTIEPGIRALKPGEIIIRDVRDVLGAPPTP